MPVETSDEEEAAGYRCPIVGCSRSFTTLFGLKLHLKRGHGIAALRACPVCGRTFKGPRSLLNHASQMDDLEHVVLWWCLKDYSCRSRSWRYRKEKVLECVRNGKVEIPFRSVF